MIFLKKPYTPTVLTSTSKTFTVYGASFFRIKEVYLTGKPYINTSFYNPFATVPKLSAKYPGFTGVKLLTSDWQTDNDHTLTFTIPSATNPGYIDIIVENEAGYGKLTQNVVKNLYSNTQTLKEIRPWAFGIEVLSGGRVSPFPFGQLFTIDGIPIYTISGNNMVKIQ